MRESLVARVTDIIQHSLHFQAGKAMHTHERPLRDDASKAPSAGGLPPMSERLNQSPQHPPAADICALCCFIRSPAESRRTCPCVLKAACCLSKDAHINLGDAQLASNPPGTPAALVSSICFPARFAATRPLRTFLCFGAARCACFAGGGNSKGTTCTRGGELDGMVAVVLWWRAHNSSEDTAAGKEAPSTSRAAGWLVTFGLFGSIRGRCFL
mmetsp:Transcript_27246/g.51890  ORF Transcript_27246/g.51890 Transcript_27246/m.51890 type:complete len:213 (-) Transcript_27246:335-973(-)